MWTDVGLAWELVEQPQSKKQFFVSQKIEIFTLIFLIRPHSNEHEEGRRHD